MTNLILPPGMTPVLDATIQIELADAIDTDRHVSDLYYQSYNGSFTIDPDEYVIGIVNSKGHQDRLRDQNAPIQEIFVLAESEEVIDWSIEEILRRFRLKFEYLADPSNTVFLDAQLERMLGHVDYLAAT